MSNLPETLKPIMFDKNNNAYAYAGLVKAGSEKHYLYTKDPTLTDRENIIVADTGYIYYTEEVEFLYIAKQDIYQEGAKYVDERNRVYTLVKDGRNDPAFTNQWVKLVFLDEEGKTKARDANGKSITPGYSIVRRL